jgi:cytochrome P450
MNADLLDPGALREPHQFFARLRERSPVVWSEAHKAWIVTYYDGVLEAFRDVELLSSDRLTPLERRLSEQRQQTLALTFDVLRGWMTFHDAPRHDVLRDPVRRAFTPRRIADLRPKIERIAVDMLDSLAEVEQIDFKDQFAFPLPAIVIAELLGVPIADRERFKTWSKKLAAIVFGESGNADQATTAAEGTAEFHDYFQWLITQRTSAPGDDLVSALLAARSGEPGEGLSNMEVVGACTLLLFAGHETTTNALTNAMLALLRAPDSARVLADAAPAPATAVDELLRFDGPVKVMPRSVATDHERGGQQLRRGEIVYLAVAGANRDPVVFPEPDRLDLNRPAKPAHIAFGQGPHFCLGHALARLEMAIALPAALRRFPRMSLVSEQVDWDPLILVRSATELPIALRGR